MQFAAPPGHHADTDLAGGFCYLNNVAIAAEHVVKTQGRTAILDIDVHHGNGTQEIFYERGDVQFVSLHADPNETYPFFVGYADETGRGAGEGTNLNLPLPKLAGDEIFLEALDQGLAAIEGFAPPMLLLSLGFDAYEGDPQQEGAVTLRGFTEAGRRIAELGLPTVLVQEGGYAIDDLGKTLDAFLRGFSQGRGARSDRARQGGRWLGPVGQKHQPECRHLTVTRATGFFAENHPPRGALT